MTKRRTSWLKIVTVLALGLVCFAKTPTFTGKIVAYDLLAHAGKAASFVENREVLVLETPARKQKYMKVVFKGFGTVQVDPKFFAGDTPLTVRADRDKTCDEHFPTILPQIPNPKAGIYLLTDPYKNAPPPRIKTLECYVAAEKKK